MEPLQPLSDKDTEFFFLLEKCLIFVCFSCLRCFLMTRNEQVTFAEKQQVKMNSLKKQKHLDLFHTWSNKGLKGSFVNPTLPSLHGGSLEITLTVPYRLLFTSSSCNVFYCVVGTLRHILILYLTLKLLRPSPIFVLVPWPICGHFFTRFGEVKSVFYCHFSWYSLKEKIKRL